MGLTILVNAADRLGAGGLDAEDPVLDADVFIAAASVVEVTGRLAVWAVGEWVDETESIALDIWTILNNTVVCMERENFAS